MHETQREVPWCGKMGMISELAINSLNQLEDCTWLFPKINSTADVWYISWHNSSLLQGLGNEMKLKSRLQPFSLICIQCQFMFCYQFGNPPPSNKCCYMPTVWLDTLGHSKSISWDYVFSQLTKKYQWSAWQCTWFMFQSNTESNSSSRYGFITIQLQINHYCSLKKYANQIFTFTVLKLLVYTKSDSIAKLVNIIFTLFSMTVITFSSMWCIFYTWWTVVCVS